MSERGRDGWGAGESRWRLLAAGVVVAGLVLLAAFGGLGYGLSALGDSAASTGRSLKAVVSSPHRDGPPPFGLEWRLTAANAVIFYPGYFCATGPSGLRVRLVLALRELQTLGQGSTKVLGPFSLRSQARVGC